MSRSPVSAFRSPRLLRWALWFALVAGLGQAAVISITRIATDRLIWATSDVVWMAPLANAIVFVVAALVVRLITWGRSGSVTSGCASGIFLFLFLIGPLLLVPRLHPYAAVLLAAGLAVQGARMVGARIESFDRLVQRTLPLLVGLCAVLGVGIHVKDEVVARRAETSLPTAAADSPNVILIVLDTVRAQSTSLNGYTRQTTPQVDKFARTGVVFERAIATAPWTLPSHASFFTGRHPNELTANWLTPLDGTHTTLAEAFGARGYVTVGFVANLIYATSASGLNRGFVRYSDFPLSGGMLIRESWLARALVKPLRSVFGDTDELVHKSASDVTDEFVAWLPSRPHKPFFAFLNYFDAHAPYLPPPPFAAKFGTGEALPDLRSQDKWSREETQRWNDAYDGAIAYVDEQVGRLLQRLETDGLLQDTLVVVTSDHGEQFGEHSLFDHANSLYRQVLQVPLVISFPSQVPAGTRISDPVSLIDLPATMLDLASSGADGPMLPGRSLANYWRSPSQGENEGPIFSEVSKTINMLAWMPASKGDMQSVVVNGMHYILNGDGREEMYDFNNDVAEVHDLAPLGKSRSLLDEARRTLKKGPKTEATGIGRENAVDRN